METFNNMMYAMYLGYFLIGEPIPNSVLEYIKEFDFDKNDRDLQVVFSMLKNGNHEDETLRGLVIATLL